MGITGLIPFIEKASSKVQLRDLRGTTMAVDTYCWLHKGVFSCAEKLVRGEETDKYLQYCLRYVQMLLSYDIKPILVFDGRHLPAKALTEQRRRESRKTSKRLAAELLRAGRTEEARSHMRRCVDVTHEMALRLIQECRMRNVDCIVAPYEADAQLAWLNRLDLAQYVITEDSDLTLFGARKIIFKLDLTGNGLLVDSDKLHLAMGCHANKYSFEKFQRMCILSGCDYLDSLPGIGLAKACKFMLMTEEDNMRRALTKIPAYLNMRHLDVNDTYIESFLKAEATFRHMYIYNPALRQMERLNPLELYKTDEELCSNAGTLLEDKEQAFQLALGNLDPFKLIQVDNWHPDNVALKLPKGVTRAKHKSIWRPNDKTNSPHKKPKQLAMVFKKINYLSPESVVEEAKPTELNIVNMYSNMTEQMKSGSLKCHCLDESPTHEKRKIIVTPTKSFCNPFAKSHGESRQPAVCENSSLLKMLTPKKSTQRQSDSENSETTPTNHTSPALQPSPKRPLQTKGNNLKRTLFAMQAKPVPTVKSRFFSNNVKKSPQQAVEEDISTKIEYMMACAKEQKEQLELFYNESPSPCKKIQKLETTTSPNETKTDNCLDTDCVTLISDEESNETTSNLPIKMLSVKKVAPRMGLSRNKSSAKSKPALNEGTQSLLSKFGFQRRPLLK